ncbi:hypothetical protein CL633_01295 [bacterium]|nr:hypothetical protein [bacterium]|tara:strand:- start:3106 stop:4221 length:1116 start_codon:yes stop_codon:yes gene_type:complete
MTIENQICKKLKTDFRLSETLNGCSCNLHNDIFYIFKIDDPKPDYLRLRTDYPDIQKIIDEYSNKKICLRLGPRPANETEQKIEADILSFFKHPNSYVLLFTTLPEFNKAIEKIRKQFNIKIDKLKNELCQFFKKSKVNFTKKDWARLDSGASVDAEIMRLVDSWIQKKIPNIYKITIKQLNLIKVPCDQEAVKAFTNFILFNFLDNYLVIFKDIKKSLQKDDDRLDIFLTNNIDVILSPAEIRIQDIFEPYISIKIYGDTNITNLKLQKLGKEIKEMQKDFLPSAYKIKTHRLEMLRPNQENRATLTQRAVYQCLRNKWDLSPKKISSILESFGLGMNLIFNTSDMNISKWRKLLLFYETDALKEHKKYF